MKIITFDNIIEINNLLKEKNLKISLKDACGKQSMMLKYLDTNEKIKKDTVSEETFKLITDYFNSKNINIEYSLDKVFIFSI